MITTYLAILAMVAIGRGIARAIDRSARRRRQSVLTAPSTTRCEPVLIAQKQTQRQRKTEAERQQAAADEAFLIEQIDKLYQMLWEADEDLELARQNCQHDNEMNRAGAVVADKVVNKHRADRDKLAKKVMNLERQIHAFESKLNKCRFVLSA